MLPTVKKNNLSYILYEEIIIAFPGEFAEQDGRINI